MKSIMLPCCLQSQDVSNSTVLLLPQYKVTAHLVDLRATHTDTHDTYGVSAEGERPQGGSCVCFGGLFT